MSLIYNFVLILQFTLLKSFSIINIDIYTEGKSAMNVRKILSIILGFALLFGVVYVATPTASAVMKYNEYTTETNVGNLNMAPWNNDDIRVRLASGAWADPVVIDYNDDGYLDLLVSGSAVVYNGTLIFYGGPDSTNHESDDYLHMDKGRYVMGGQAYMGGNYIYDEDGNYEKTVITVDNRVMLDVKTKSGFDFDLEKFNSNSSGVKKFTDGGALRVISWPVCGCFRSHVR